MNKRFVYDYCKNCKQATPHTIVIQNRREKAVVKAKCNYCGNKIEVEWKE